MKLFNYRIVFICFFLMVISVFVMLTPPSAHAAGVTQGYITVKGEPKNGIQVTVHAKFKSDEGSPGEPYFVMQELSTLTVTGGPNHLPGWFDFSTSAGGVIACYDINTPTEFRVVPEIPAEIAGSVKMQFVSTAFAASTVISPSGNIITRSDPHQVDPSTPLPPLPPNCRYEIGTDPGRVEENVATPGSKNYVIVCDEQPKPSGPACAGPCTLSDAAACQGAGKPAGCKCIPQDGNQGTCQTCPSAAAAASITTTCEVGGGKWDARVDMSNYPKSDIGGKKNARQLLIAEKNTSLPTPEDQFGCGQAVSSFTTDATNVVHIDRNLTGGWVKFEDCKPLNGTPRLRPGPSPLGLEPLVSSKRYVLMINNNNLSCRPIIELPPVQDTCPGPSTSPVPSSSVPACNGVCDTRNSTCPSGVGNETCTCVPNSPTTTAGVCKPNLTCNSPCDTTRPTDCQNVTDKNAGGQTCNICIPSGTGNTGSCGGPTCNSKCVVSRPNSCLGAVKDGVSCSACLPDSPGSDIGTCKPVVACNTPCDPRTADACKGATNANKDDCSTCKPGPSGGGSTCQALAADKCTCDGITATNLIPGQVATFTAFAVVINPDKNVASKISTMTFHVARDNTKIFDSDAIPTTVVSTSDPHKTRYQAVWKFTIPANINPKALYRVWAEEPNCSSNQASVQVTASNQAVLGAETQPNVFQQFLNFLANLNPFGSRSSGGSTSPAATPVVSDRNLQLKTLGQAQITDQQCRFVFFKFTNVVEN